MQEITNEAIRKIDTLLEDTATQVAANAHKQNLGSKLQKEFAHKDAHKQMEIDNDRIDDLTKQADDYSAAHAPKMIDTIVDTISNQ